MEKKIKYSKNISIEICGGPHVKNTGELPKIEIYKQKMIGEGKLRIYARFKEDKQ